MTASLRCLPALKGLWQQLQQNSADVESLSLALLHSFPIPLSYTHLFFTFHQSLPPFLSFFSSVPPPPPHLPIPPPIYRHTSEWEPSKTPWPCAPVCRQKTANKHMQDDTRRGRPAALRSCKHLLLTRWFLRWPCAQPGVESWPQWRSVCCFCRPGTPRCLRSRSPPAATTKTTTTWGESSLAALNYLSNDVTRVNTQEGALTHLNEPWNRNHKNKRVLSVQISLHKKEGGEALCFICTERK